MKKINLSNSRFAVVLISFFACVLASAAYAQELKPRPRKDCVKMCKVGFKDPRSTTKFAGKKLIKLLDEIDASIEKETDPAKIRELNAKKAAELEKYEDRLSTMCDEMCGFLPE